MTDERNRTLIYPIWRHCKPDIMIKRPAGPLCNRTLSNRRWRPLYCAWQSGWMLRHNYRCSTDHMKGTENCTSINWRHYGYPAMRRSFIQAEVSRMYNTMTSSLAIGLLLRRLANDTNTVMYQLIVFAGVHSINMSGWRWRQTGSARWIDELWWDPNS